MNAIPAPLTAPSGLPFAGTENSASGKYEARETPIVPKADRSSGVGPLGMAAQPDWIRERTRRRTIARAENVRFIGAVIYRQDTGAPKTGQRARMGRMRSDGFPHHPSRLAKFREPLFSHSVPNYEKRDLGLKPKSLLLLPWCRRRDLNPHGFPHHHRTALFQSPNMATFAEPNGPVKIPGNPTPKPKTRT